MNKTILKNITNDILKNYSNIERFEFFDFYDKGKKWEIRWFIKNENDGFYYMQINDKDSCENVISELNRRCAKHNINQNSVEDELEI